MKIIRSTKGMSIIEIIISLAILGFVSVGIMGFFTDSFKFQARSQSTVAIQKMADDVIEQLRSSGYAQIGNEEIGLTNGTKTVDGYTYIINVNEDEIGSGINLYDVELTIKAPDGIEITMNNQFRLSRDIVVSVGGENKTHITPDEDNQSPAYNDPSKPAIYIKYELAGGIYEGTELNKVKITQPLTYNVSPTIPFWIGHTFLGWRCNVPYDTTKKVLTITEDLINQGNDIIFTARWTGTEYNVKFDVGKGGTIEPGKENKTIYYGAKYEELPEISLVEIKGYVPSYVWFSTDMGKIVTPDTTVTLAKNHELTAKYTQTPIKYNVIYNSVKPEKASGTINGNVSSTNHIFDKPSTLSSNVYELKGWTQEGWNTKEDLTGVLYPLGYAGEKENTLGETVLNLTDVSRHGNNVNLYTQWKQNTYTVSFDANGGSCSTSSKTITYDEKYGELPTALPATNTFNTFIGWYLDGTEVTSDDLANIADSDHTLTAYWSCSCCTKINCTICTKCTVTGCGVCNKHKAHVYCNSKVKTLDQRHGCQTIHTWCDCGHEDCTKGCDNSYCEGCEQCTACYGHKECSYCPENYCTHSHSWCCCDHLDCDDCGICNLCEQCSYCYGHKKCIDCQQEHCDGNCQKEENIVNVEDAVKDVVTDVVDNVVDTVTDTVTDIVDNVVDTFKNWFPWW